MSLELERRPLFVVEALREPVFARRFTHIPSAVMSSQERQVIAEAFYQGHCPRGAWLLPKPKAVHELTMELRASTRDTQLLALLRRLPPGHEDEALHRAQVEAAQVSAEPFVHVGEVREMLRRILDSFTNSPTKPSGD